MPGLRSWLDTVCEPESTGSPAKVPTAWAWALADVVVAGP